MKKNPGKKKAWTEKDFITSLTRTMKMQEKQNPLLKRMHFRLTPEWREITTLIHRLILTPSPEEETHFIENLVQFGKKALYPLIDTLLSYKERDLKNIRENLK